MLRRLQQPALGKNLVCLSAQADSAVRRRSGRSGFLMQDFGLQPLPVLRSQLCIG
jgi:hypothetical protein